MMLGISSSAMHCHLPWIRRGMYQWDKFKARLHKQKKEDLCSTPTMLLDKLTMLGLRTKPRATREEKYESRVHDNLIIQVWLNGHLSITMFHALIVKENSVKRLLWGIFQFVITKINRHQLSNSNWRDPQHLLRGHHCGRLHTRSV